MSSLNHNSYITSSPIDPEPVDIGYLLDNLSAPDAARLTELADIVSAMFSPDALSDEELMQVVSERIDFYVSAYEDNTEQALLYLGVKGDTAGEVGASDAHQTSGYQSQDAYTAQPKPSSAFGDFYKVITDEYRSVGADEEEINESTKKLIDESSAFGNDLAADLDERLDRFGFVARSFGNPDVLRAEGKDAALAYFEELRDRLENLGDRPEREAVSRRIGAILTGRKTMTGTEFDVYSTRILAEFKLKTPQQLLDTYVQNAMLNYAESIYGSTEFIANKGFESDSTYLFDSFKASRLRQPMRPLMPTDIVARCVKQRKNDMLFGDSEWSKRFSTRSAQSEWRWDERKHRERMFKNSFRDTASKPYGTERRFEKRDEIGERIAKLPLEARQLMLDLSRLIGSISDRSMSSDFRKMIDELKGDFIDRLEQIDDFRSYEVIRVVRSAMIELHPDKHPTKQNAENLYKFYSLLRDVSSSQNKVR